MRSTRQIARCFLLLTFLGAARFAAAAEVYIQLPADAQGLDGRGETEKGEIVEQDENEAPRLCRGATGFDNLALFFHGKASC